MKSAVEYRFSSRDNIRVVVPDPGGDNSGADPNKDDAVEALQNKHDPFRSQHSCSRIFALLPPLDNHTGAE